MDNGAHTVARPVAPTIWLRPGHVAYIGPSFHEGYSRG
jgi:hypothetical protein